MNSGNTSRPAVVVTGASRGIGRAIAGIAASEGHTVVLVARSSEDLAAAAEQMRSAGGEVFTLALDVVADDAPLQIEQYLVGQGLTCEVLVNSAGYGLRGAAWDLSPDKQMGLVDLNVRALTRMTLHFLPAMVARKRGGVINLSSVAGFTPGPYMALYYASKGFVRSFSEALHQEVRYTGVTVTCAAPGPVKTEFLEIAGANRVPLFNLLPKTSSAKVAERAWRGFKQGRRLVVPSIGARLTILATSLLPSAMLLPLIARLQISGNDPCPCGSGKKYKKCCGARRWSLFSRS